MRQFVDLKGASGSAYRFRLAPRGEPHVGIAGNYAFIREGPAGVEVVKVGESASLSTVGQLWPEAARRGATHLFTRLNVAAATRLREHQDLIDHYGAKRVRRRSRAGARAATSDGTPAIGTRSGS